MDTKPQRVKKENRVAAIKQQLEENSAIVLIDYKGITVNDDTSFRRLLRESGIVYQVSKNTFIKRAINDQGITELDSFLEGTTSIAFGNDPVALSKVICDFAKTHPAIEIKVGLLDGKIIPAEKVSALAKLPSREVLLAQVVGGMQSPIVGFACALQGVLSNFVRVLDQVRQQKETA